MLAHEQRIWNQGFVRIAGVDEAGRGPLAGPVVAAAAVLDRSYAESESDGLLKSVTDSKALSPALREELFAFLTRCPSIRIGIGQAEPKEIDTLNILQATYLAFRRAVDALPAPPDHLLIDGNRAPEFAVPALTVIKGDARSLSIAAASIVAKVTRDRIMIDLDRRWPAFGFARHKGYPTRDHLSALHRHGPCPVHRQSFQPVRQRLLFDEGALG